MMPFCSNTKAKQLVAMAIIVGLLCPSPLALAHEDDVADAKQAFEEAWQLANNSARRRQELERRLADQASRVEKAKDELHKAASDQAQLADDLIRSERFMTALDMQIEDVRSDRQRFVDVVQSEQQDFVPFIRELASEQIEEADTGPVMGGDIVRTVLRGSLGDSVDRAMMRAALSKSRRAFVLQLLALVDECDHVIVRLSEVRNQLQGEIDSLGTKSRKLGKFVEDTTAFIDDSWRTKQLTENELSRVLAETAEISVKVIEMQQSLLSINQQLKDSKLKELDARMTELAAKKQDVVARKEAIERKDQALKLLRNAEMEALKVAQEKRNTDKRLYRDLQDAQMLLSQRKEEYAKKFQSLSGEVLPNIDTVAADKLTAEIAVLQDAIALMKTGVPADAAFDAARKKAQAAGSDAARKQYAEQLTELAAELAAIEKDMSDTIGAIDDAKSDNGLDELPNLFNWPVKGPVSAGYYDPDYKKVFGVPHKAVDIAVTYGTAVHTVAPGVVYAVKNGGAKGYSYVLIGHRYGYASLYGHLSQISVKKGDIVGYQQVIGLSGGTPGTPGAGSMTTGAHVHLEIMQNGQHINPLSVLH